MPSEQRMPNLTTRQQQVLGFMLQFLADNDQLPPMHVISSRFGFSSPNAAHEHVKALERKGFIERNAVGNFRFVRERVLAASKKVGE